MGFWNSFKGQLGRDTARAVSNKLYGDKHAILYRRVENRSSKSNLKKKVESETELKKLEYKYTHLQKLSGETDKKIQFINSLKTPTTQKGLDNLLGQLLYLLKANPWSCSNGEDEEKLINSYIDTLFAKYEHILVTMESLYPTAPKAFYYRNQYEVLKKNKFWKKNRNAIQLIIVILILTTLALISE